ncbi:MAG: DUF839 domain-containing protein [Pyrinomonadaceae bacterium]
MKRRDFIVSAGAGSLALTFSGFSKRALALGNEKVFTSLRAKGYGELFPAASKNTGETLIALPKGFEYKVFGKTGDLMKDGLKTPKDHDGMAAFFRNGEIRLVRNHEINDDVPKENITLAPDNNYDQTAGGGTTTVVIDSKTLEITRDFVSLSGTLNNCAGGATPWGSWISCEETTYGKTVFLEDDDDEVEKQKVGGFDKPHGYCFEVPASANSTVAAVPLKDMGRFSHEAVAFDAKRGIAYLTEDAKPSGFYRFLPKRFNRLAEGGTLQMLAVKDRPNFDTTKGLIETDFDVNWVTIDDPDPEEADTNETAVYEQGKAKGAAKFKKLEGCFADKFGRIYFVSSSGGDTGGGQIWLYVPTSKDEGRLRLLFEAPDRELLDMPDNVCMYPNSNFLYICEDSDYVGVGGTPENYIRILTPSGKVADFARNMTPGFEESEFAGTCFSPNGDVLFANIQEPGMTLAIWGDWKNFNS